MTASYSQAQLDAATRAVHRVTGGACPFMGDKPKPRGRRRAQPGTTTVAASLVAAAALHAAADVDPASRADQKRTEAP